MQNASAHQEQLAQPVELANLPALITPQELAGGLRVTVDMLPRLVAAGVVPAPVLAHQRTKRWSRDAVLAALGGAV